MYKRFWRFWIWQLPQFCFLIRCWMRCAWNGSSRWQWTCLSEWNQGLIPSGPVMTLPGCWCWKPSLRADRTEYTLAPKLVSPLCTMKYRNPSKLYCWSQKPTALVPVLIAYFVLAISDVLYFSLDDGRLQLSIMMLLHTPAPLTAIRSTSPIANPYREDESVARSSLRHMSL